MTFSICVREEYEVEGDGADEAAENGDAPDGEPTTHTRFGVAVTTRLPGVGALCPHANEFGAVSTQSLTNVELGRKGVEYLEDGLAVDDALQALLNADDGRENRQLHGVGREGTFAFSGEDCNGWYGHVEGGNYTVAGNLLAGESVVDAVAETYESAWAAEPSNPESDAAAEEGPREPLAKRLVDALAAGYAEGGDKREDLDVQSAALKVTTTEDRAADPYYDDLRVDATEQPIRDLRETYSEAKRGFEMAMEKYAEAYEEDEAS
ncbi:DUF1028 domain-containing protein [Halobium salinum]|uniref:DUF1028 domain-containing protein n=1 Tax=Halobium salinum TaxID=1364940 RepID=A0ABD5PBM0_9EURY|nr:DUF1028 domain-containing protein [Halobium salinum]